MNGNQSIPSPLQYSLAWQAQTGFEPSYLCAGQMAGFYAIEFAVATSNSTAASDLYNQLQRLYMSSFFGNLATDGISPNCHFTLFVTFGAMVRCSVVLSCVG
jgi:hypothetical protein